MSGNWQKAYRNKFVSADEAIKVVKSGDRVVFTHGREPLALGLALAVRRNELKDVKLYLANPHTNFDWYNPDWSDSFSVEMSYVLPDFRERFNMRHYDLIIGGLTGFSAQYQASNDIDVLLTEVSPPDENGICSFGTSVWGKKKAIKNAGIVIAEVNEELIKTCGDNSIHVSEIDYFVEHLYVEEFSGKSDLLGREIGTPGEVEEKIAQYVGTLINDGDALQIGTGNTSEWMIPLGVLDDKSDLGWHSELTPRGIIKKVRDGVINGRYKYCHQGKAISIAIGGGTKEDLEFVNNNPMFELYDADHVLDPRVIASNDNVLAINSALSIDLTGQIAAESVGRTVFGGPGGQLAFAIGAQLSKGGRFITTLPSTANEGNSSRIVSSLPEGTIVTVPRIMTDIVVTEYGIAKLRGKSQRERALDLISIAHPDFRPKLHREAKLLFWP
jgi:4-hydroxybutyrate CoA-transferase